MAVTFNGEELIITLEAGVTEVDVQVDLYTAWKTWQLTSGPDGSSNRRYPQAFRATGGDAVTTTLDAGGYFYLRNDLGWRIRPAEEDATILFIQSLVPQDATLPVIMRTLGAYTVLCLGLQPITQGVNDVELLAYRGVVWIDIDNGVPGTTPGVHGTQANPSNNLSDARVIANHFGIEEFNVRGNIVLDQSYQEWVFTSGRCGCTLDLNGQSVNNSLFKGFVINGNFGTSHVECEWCDLDNTTNFDGEAYYCGLKGTITLGAGDTVMNFCFSREPGTATPVVDFQGVGRTWQLRAYNGGIEIRNMNDASNLASIDLQSGRVVLATSCTDGTIVIRGSGVLTNNSTGTTVNDTGLVSKDGIANAVLEESVDNHAAIVNSLAEALAIVRGARLHHTLDGGAGIPSVVLDSESLMITGRLRVFLTAAAAAGATMGAANGADGEIRSTSFVTAAAVAGKIQNMRVS